jgi:hypothetical protein
MNDRAKMHAPATMVLRSLSGRKPVAPAPRPDGGCEVTRRAQDPGDLEQPETIRIRENERERRPGEKCVCDGVMLDLPSIASRDETRERDERDDDREVPRPLLRHASSTPAIASSGAATRTTTWIAVSRWPQYR